MESKVQMISYKGECAEHDEENDEREEFTMRYVSLISNKGARNTCLRADRGGGGVDERPQAMIAIAIVWQLLRVDLFLRENDRF